MSISRTLSAAAVFTLAATTSAHAEIAQKYSRPGWVEAHYVSLASASKTMAGEDYKVGYSAWAKLGAANWDVAADSFQESCPLGMFCPDFLFPTGHSSQWPSKDVKFNVPDTGNEARMKATLEVPVTLMSESMNLFKLEGSARGASFADDTLSYGVWFQDWKVFSGSKNLPWTTRVTAHCYEIAEVHADFSVGGIPVTAGMSVDGCVYIDASVNWTDNVLSGSITPGSNLDATLSAGIGVSGFSAGVYGTATVFDGRFPFSLDNRVTDTGGTVEGNVRATITGLDGEFGLYAEGFGHRYTKTLFDWTGMTYADATILTLPIAASP